MKRKIVAILAADIAGYSRLVSEDEEETLRRLNDYQRLFGEVVSAGGGCVFKTAGDSVLAEFTSAVDALRCAISVQESLRIRNQAYPASRQMAYRIGITIGDVVERDGDLLGDGVNIAARIEALASPGGICVSKALHDAVSSTLSVNFKDMGPQSLKNIATPTHVFAVVVGNDTKTIARSGAKGAGWGSPANILAATAVAVVSAALVWFLQGPSAQTPAAAPTTKAAAVTGSDQNATSIGTPDAAASKDSAGQVAAVAPPKADAGADALSGGDDPAAAERLRPIRWTACRGDDTPSVLDACRELARDGALANESRAEAQWRLGLAQRKSGDVEGAVASLSESIKSSPTAAAHADRGTAYLLKGDFAKASADYDEAIRRNPDNGEAWNNRAWARYKTGAYADALEDANQAVKLIGKQAFVWDTRGHIQEALGQRAAAQADFAKALSIDPDLATSKAALKRMTVR